MKLNGKSRLEQRCTVATPRSIHYGSGPDAASFVGKSVKEKDKTGVTQSHRKGRSPTPHR